MDQLEFLNNLFQQFKIKATCESIEYYQLSTNYIVRLYSNGRIKNIEKYLPELALALNLNSLPQLETNLSEGTIIIKAFNSIKNRSNNFFTLASSTVLVDGNLNCLLGETYEGKAIWMDLTENPHMLVSGTTGSGKSTALHIIIANLLFYPEVNIFLMDPKCIEFSKYEQIAHKRKIKIASAYIECLKMIQNLYTEMERRYQLMNAFKLNKSYFPYYVLIIDEFAALMAQDLDKKFHDFLLLLAQKCRAAGMHIILSTQRPSVDIIDGTIKSNFPARLSCKVASSIDSRIILDSVGAEKLLGKGDALLNNISSSLQRLQLAFTTPDEIISYI